MDPTGVEFGIIFVLLAFLYWLVPYTSQSTIKFGVRVPPEKLGDILFRKLNSLYYKSLAVVSITIFISLVVVPDWFGFYQASLAAFVMEIVSSYLIFVYIHRRLLRVKREEGWYIGVKEATGVIIPGDVSNANNPVFRVLLTLSVGIIAATAVMGAVLYPDIPMTIITHFNQNGIANGFISKSLLSVFTIPIAQVLLTSSLVVMSYLIWKSRQELEVYKPNTSYAQQVKFKRYTMYSIASVSIIINSSFLFLAAISWGILSKNYVSVLTYFPSSIILMVLAPMLYLGQQGSRIRIDFSENATGLVNRNDDQYWKGGIFYLNSGDQSFLVAKRFGVGWTLNFGNPLTWTAIGGLLLLLPVMGPYLALM